MIPPFPTSFAELSFFDQVAILFINAVGLSLFLTVWAHTKLKNKKDQVLMTMGLFMFLWVDFAYLARLFGEPNMYWAEIALRIAWIATPIFFTYVYLITVYIIGLEKRYKILNRIIIIEGILLSLITATTDYVVAGIKFTNTNIDIQYGIGFMPFLVLIAFNILATLIPFVTFLRTYREKERPSGIGYFIVGLSIFYIFNGIFNIALPVFLGISDLYFFGDYSLVFFVSFTSYAIFRGSLFNIHVLKTDLLVTILWVSILIRIVLISQETNLFISTLVNLVLITIVMVLSIFFIRSVTDEIKQKEKVAIANRQLEKLNEEKTAFLNFASHELRYAPTVIRNYASMILEGSIAPATPKAHETIQTIFNLAQGDLKLVDDYLNVSRIEQGRMQYTFTKVNITKLISDVVDNFQEVARQTKTTVVKKFDTQKEVSVTIDESKIKEVLNNLVDNAVEKYAKGATVEISLADDAVNKKVLITLHDTGIGMSKETLAKLFQRFARAKNVENSINGIKGSGLGLYLAREYVFAHGGRIWAESAGEGKGSVFFLELPYMPIDPKEGDRAVFENLSVPT